MVRTRTIDLAKETFWREQMERQAASGLNIAAWCRHNQVSCSLFHHWRRTLALRDGRDPAQGSRPALGAAAFVPVLVEAPPAPGPVQTAGVSPGSGFIEIRFQHRSARVRVAPGFDAPTLARLLDVLEQRAC